MDDSHLPRSLVTISCSPSVLLGCIQFRGLHSCLREARKLPDGCPSERPRYFYIELAIKNNQNPPTTSGDRVVGPPMGAEVKVASTGACPWQTQRLSLLRAAFPLLPEPPSPCRTSRYRAIYRMHNLFWPALAASPETTIGGLNNEFRGPTPTPRHCSNPNHPPHA